LDKWQCAAVAASARASAVQELALRGARARAAVLLATALTQRAGAVDPARLWLDEVWVATLVKRASLRALLALH
jgi:hypothetical protein